MKDKKMPFGEKVYQLMVDRGWSNTDLAKKMKVTPSRITRLLQSKNPRIHTIYKVAKVFGIKPLTLI